MSFLKTLFWVIFFVGFTIFAINNWQPVSMKLWNGLWLDSKLPAVIGASFLLGFVPLNICGECASDTDCDMGQTCTPAEASMSGITGSVCT